MLKIGTKKKVHVTRLITEKTVEGKILSIMRNKDDKEEKDMTNLLIKRSATLTRKDYDLMFGCDV